MFSPGLLAALVLSGTFDAAWARSLARSPDKRQSFNFINVTQYNSTPTTVDVSVSLNAGGRNQTSPLLYGWSVLSYPHAGTAKHG
jgi:hypothetical protein